GPTITVTTSTNDFTGAVSLSGGTAGIQTANALQLGTVNLTGGLTATAVNGSVTQSGAAFTVGGAASFTAGGANSDVLLTTPANDFAGSVSASGRDISLRGANAVVLDTIAPTRDLTVIAGTDITQGPAFAVPGASSFTGNTITLNGANDFGGAVAL